MFKKNKTSNRLDIFYFFSVRLNQDQLISKISLRQLYNHCDYKMIQMQITVG